MEYWMRKVVDLSCFYILQFTITNYYTNFLKIILLHEQNIFIIWYLIIRQLLEYMLQQ